MRLQFLLQVLICLLARQALAQVPYDTLQAFGQTTIYFDFGRDALRPDAVDTLNQLLADPENRGDKWIDIEAHTDSIGSSTANHALARRRAQAVAAYLIRQGWPEDRIRKTAVGEGKPLLSNETEEGRQANRRATITLLRRRILTTISGQVVDEQSGVALESMVHIQARDWVDSTRSHPDGRFAYTLPAGEVVRVDVRRAGHFFSSQMLRAMPGLKPLEIRIKPVVPGAKSDIQHLYFVGDQAVLLPRSEPELPVLLQFMQLNPGISVEIAGHVNQPWSPPVDSTMKSFQLSMDRARMVYDYLRSQGVPEHRLTYNGYGNWEMRFPHATTHQQQALNRRVEIRVLSTGDVISKKQPLQIE